MEFRKNDKLVVVDDSHSDLTSGQIVYVAEVLGSSLIRISCTPGGKLLLRDGVTSFRKNRFEHATAKLDITKEVETAEGTPVVIITTNGRDAKFPVLAYEGAAKSTSKYTKDGIHSSGVARRNLRNVVPKPKEQTAYANVYKNSKGGMYTTSHHKTSEEAVANAASDAVGRVKIVMIEGVFAE